MTVKQTGLFWIVEVTLSLVRNIFAAAKQRFNAPQFYNRTDIFGALTEEDILDAVKTNKVLPFYDGNENKRYVLIPKKLAKTKRQAIQIAINCLRWRFIGGSEESDEERANYLRMLKRIEKMLEEQNGDKKSDK